MLAAPPPPTSQAPSDRGVARSRGLLPSATLPSPSAAPTPAPASRPPSRRALARQRQSAHLTSLLTACWLLGCVLAPASWLLLALLSPSPLTAAYAAWALLSMAWCGLRLAPASPDQAGPRSSSRPSSAGVSVSTIMNAGPDPLAAPSNVGSQVLTWLVAAAPSHTVVR